jgi:hypothetical protein
MDIEGLIAAELEAQRAKRMNGGAGNGSAATLRVPIIERPFTDAGNAERLHALYGGRFRYSHPQRTFFVWDGRRWAPDDKGVM